MKKTLIIFRKWILVFVIIIFSIFGKPLAGILFPKNKSVDKFLMQTASEINKSCPYMVNKETRVDNAVALMGNTIQFNYTMTNHLKEEIDISQLKINTAKPLLNGIKTSPNLKIFRDNRVTMIYEYKDKVGVFLFSLQFKYDDYKQ